MQSQNFHTGCWTALLLVIISLATVCANSWEVYNEDDGPDGPDSTSNVMLAEEIFLPVNKRAQSTLKQAPSASVDVSKRRNLHTNTKSNLKVSAGLETPTLKGTSLDPEAEADLAGPEVPLGHEPKSIHRSEDGGEKVVHGLSFEQEQEEEVEKKKKSGENIDKEDNSLHTVRQFSQVGEEKHEQQEDINGERNGPQQIHRQKKVAKLRKLQNPELTLDLSPEQHQQHQQQQQKSSTDGEEESHKVRELLEHEPEVIGEDEPGVEEIFVREGSEQSLLGDGQAVPDCPPDSNTWECLMLTEDLIAFRDDQNLSGATSYHRTKRQSTGNGNGGTGTTTNNDDDIVASGDGNDLYPDSESKGLDVPIPQSITFNASENSDLGTFRQELITELRRKYANVPGFQDVSVDDVVQNPDGTVDVNYTVTVNTDAAEYATLTNDQYVDALTGELGRVGSILPSTLEVGGRSVVQGPSTDGVGAQAANALSDPCAMTQCSRGFHQCRDMGNRVVQCQHKCETFESEENCQHGSTCELDGNFEPFCSCTKRWSGDRCQLPVRNKELDEGEITGVAFGAAVLACGVIGSCCWFLLCRRRNKEPIFTHYSDEEGSGRFSNPSSKLSNFVIDRPRISVAPLNTFNPNNGSSGSANSGSRPNRPRFSNA